MAGNYNLTEVIKNNKMLKSWTYKEQGLDAKVELFHDHVLWTKTTEQLYFSLEEALCRPVPIGPNWIDAELIDYLQLLLGEVELSEAGQLIFAFYKGLQSHKLVEQSFFWPKLEEKQLQAHFSAQGLQLLEESPYQILPLQAQRLWHFYLQGSNIPGLPFKERRLWSDQIKQHLRWPQLAPPFALLDYSRLPQKRYEAQDENNELHFLWLEEDFARIGQGRGSQSRSEKRSYEQLLREGEKGLPNCLAAYWPMLYKLLQRMYIRGQMPQHQEKPSYEGPAPGQAPPA